MNPRIIYLLLAAAVQSVVLQAQIPRSADLSVPEIPAFTVLGLSPQNVTRPASPREFVTSVLNGIDADGNIQSGIALELAPYLVLAGNSLTLEKYKADPVKQILSRTSFSLATTRGASDDDKSAKVATGLHITLIDRGDPRLSTELANCFANLSLVPPIPPGPGAAAVIAQAEKKLREEWQACRTAFNKKLWNKTSWGLGLAATWVSPDGNAEALESDRRALWTTYALGLGERAQILLHGRYLQNEKIENPVSAGQMLNQDSWILGTRVRFGLPDFAGSLEATFSRKEPEGLKADQGSTVLLGLEHKLASDLWLQLSVGREMGYDRTNDQMILRSSFKYAFSQTPSFGLTP
jgi:hypothetical protein